MRNRTEIYLKQTDYLGMTQSNENPKQKPNSLKLSLLVALVVGSIIGSGVFGILQNMAAGAGAGAILIGWTITGIGMLLLARVYQMLALRKPELDNGVYAYARALSGEYVGFNSAWGYWISAWIGNVGYLVAAFAALGYFFPAFGEGNTQAAIIGASLLVWVVHFLVLRGIAHGRVAAITGHIHTARVGRVKKPIYGSSARKSRGQLGCYRDLYRTHHFRGRWLSGLDAAGGRITVHACQRRCDAYLAGSKE